MNREFLDLYNRELAVLREQAKEFAEEFPGVADRLGGLVADRMDPAIMGLLEGAAFLAARVQLKLDHEYLEFTQNLLEQLVPQYLSPSPSVLLAKIDPPFSDPALKEGRTIPRGSVMDATYRERERRVACRFQLTSDITLWPLDVLAADYTAAIGSLHALGVPVGPDVRAGLRLTLGLRTADRLEDEPPDSAAADTPALRLSSCRVSSLRVHLLGPDQDAIALYEQLFGHLVGVHLRYLDAFGDPVAITVPLAQFSQIGFSDNETLVPRDLRVFHGFDLLRDYFLFPRKYLGFRLDGLRPLLARIPAKSVDVVFSFSEVAPRLSAAVRPDMFALHTAPAVNLFEKTTDRIQVKPNQHEYQVVPDRSRMLDYEPHRILSVEAHIAGTALKVPVAPVYAGTADRSPGQRDYRYSVRRLPRRRSARERQYGSPSDYVGTELYLSLGGGAGIDEASEVAELSVRALCSNRHLTETLPVGESGADFRLLDDTALDIRCLAGPTRPREPVVSALRTRTEQAGTGAVAWRLVSLLTLNHLGLVRRAGGEGAAALREILTLFADTTDSATDRRIRGVRQVDSRPVTRRIRQSQGVGVARGLEVSVTLDEKAFEGSGVFLLGAVLDRFLAEAVSINHFTQTVIVSSERGEVMRWPARSGRKGVL